MSGRFVPSASPEHAAQRRAALQRCRELDVGFMLVPDLFELTLDRVNTFEVGGLPLIGLKSARIRGWNYAVKRAMDIIIALAVLIGTSPLLLLIAIAIKLDSPGPVLFSQERVGKDWRRFICYKFRTMFADAEERKAEVVHLNMHRNRDPRMTKIPDDPRVTTVGRLLRRFSIDELPQLINVVKGEMSLVGPRPLILEEDQYVQEWARKRLDIKPGITGLWQVLGRSDIPFDEMTKLDYVYVTNWSLREDLRLIFLTIPSLFRTRRAF